MAEKLPLRLRYNYVRLRFLAKRNQYYLTKIKDKNSLIKINNMPNEKQ